MWIDVVLCGECIHYDRGLCSLLECKIDDVSVVFPMEYNDYCSDGERVVKDD